MDSLPWILHLTGVQISSTSELTESQWRISNRLTPARGFKSENPTLFGLMIIQHNFVSSHGGLGGKTPAEAAGIMLSGHNKWLTMIRHAAVFCA